MQAAAASVRSQSHRGSLIGSHKRSKVRRFIVLEPASSFSDDDALWVWCWHYHQRFFLVYRLRESTSWRRSLVRSRPEPRSTGSRGSAEKPIGSHDHPHRWRPPPLRLLSTKLAVPLHLLRPALAEKRIRRRGHQSLRCSNRTACWIIDRCPGSRLECSHCGLGPSSPRGSPHPLSGAIPGLGAQPIRRISEPGRQKAECGNSG